MKTLCRNCEFFDMKRSHYKRINAIGNEEWLEKGECCINPPTADGFPEVFGDNFCGKAEPKKAREL